MVRSADEGGGGEGAVPTGAIAGHDKWLSRRCPGIRNRTVTRISPPPAM
jgi:hypothetical protein